MAPGAGGACVGVWIMKCTWLRGLVACLSVVSGVAAAPRVVHVPFHGDEPFGVGGTAAPLRNARDLELTGGGVQFGKGVPAPEIVLPEWRGEQGTAAFWIKSVDWDATTKEHVVFLKPMEPVGGSFLVYKYITADKIWFYGALPTGPQRDRVRVHFAYAGLQEWKRGEWHHLAFCWKRGSVAKLFVDGRLTNTAKGAFFFPEAMAGISFGDGGRRGSMGGKVQSIMRDLYVSPLPLSDTEVSLLAGNRPPDVGAEPEAGPSRPPNVIPCARPATPPVLDGNIGAGEYPTTLPCLIATDRHVAYPEPARFCLGVDAASLYIAGSIALPEGHTPTSLANTRDSSVLVAKGDLFCLFVRSDAQTESKAFDGAYMTVAPNGTVYDAHEAIDWEAMSCTRQVETDYQAAVKSVVSGGVWTVELRLPRDELKLPPSGSFCLSAAFKLGSRRFAIQDHPTWVDHHQAFAECMLTDIGVDCQLGALSQGDVTTRFEVTNVSAAAVACRASLQVAIPQITTTANGMVVEQKVGEEIAVRTGRPLHQWSHDLAVPAGGVAEATSVHRLEEPGMRLLTLVLAVADTPVYRQALPFVFAPPLTIMLRPLPSSDELAVHLSFDGVDPTVLRQAKVDLVSVETGVAAAETVRPVSTRTALWRLSTKDMPTGVYDVRVSAFGTGDRAIAQRTVRFEKRPVPAWRRDRKGVRALEPDWVPAPWTPVAVNGNTVSVWGRSYEFGGGGLLSGITSQNVPLLGAVASVRLVADAGEQSVEIGAGKVASRAPGVVRITHAGSVGDLRLTSEQVVEFDGLVRVDLSLSPLRPVSVERLWIEIPFTNAPLLYATGHGVWSVGRTVDRQWTSLPHVWLGNDAAGCAVFAENCKGWLLNSTKPRVTLESEDGVARLRLLIVNEPTVIREPMSITFGLQATPLKPFFAGWRALRPQGWGWTKPPTSLYMAGPTAWMSSYSVPCPRNWELPDQMVAFARKSGQTVYPYLTPFTISMYDMVRRDLPYMLPGQKMPESAVTHHIKDSRPIEDYWYYAEEWALDPPRFTGDGSGKETTQLACVSPSSSWADYFVWHVHRILSESDIDGFYFDLAGPRLNFDPAKGYSYTTTDGVVEGTNEYFAARDLYKRLYCVFDQLRGRQRKPYILGHGSAAQCPTSSFWDINFHGEGIKPRSKYELSKLFLQDRLDGNPIAGAAQPDAARSNDALAYRCMNGAQFGLPVMFLPQYGRNRELNLKEHSREHLLWTVLHNNLLWPAYIPAGPVYEFWRTVEIPFDLGTAVFHPYWTNGVRAEPECVRVSYWRKQSVEDFLVAAGNWSEADRDAVIHLPVQLSGLSGENAETGEELTVTDVLRVRIPHHDVGVFRLKR